MKQTNQQAAGQGLVEYALILVLVAVIVIAILTLLGPQVGNVFSRVVNGLGVVASSGGGGGAPPPAPADVTSVNTLRGGPDVVVLIEVSAATNVTVVDSQSGKTASTSCDPTCNVTLSAVGPNPGTVTVTADGGSSLSASYPAQN
jgi:pilus assembly protein Flp/PilA